MLNYKQIWHGIKLTKWLNKFNLIGFLPMMEFIFALNMFMHFHALHVSFLFFLPPCLMLWLCFSLISLSLSFSLLIMAPKKSVPSKNLICRGSSSSSLTPDSIRFRDEKHELTSLRTSLTRQFIQNARSFCLIYQTLVYQVLLALVDGLLFVSNP